MSVVPLPPRGEWYPDARHGDRVLRVSWHEEAGCAVLSTWRGDTCVGTTRLVPEEVARLVGSLAAGLAASVPAAAAASVPAAEHGGVHSG